MRRLRRHRHHGSSGSSGGGGSSSSSMTAPERLRDHSRRMRVVLYRGEGKRFRRWR
jgi:hypothetical protein